jgi:hypothetical protein
MEAHPLKSSRHQRAEFFRSFIWQDIQTEFLEWLEQIRTELEVEDDIDIIRRLQGNAEALRKMLMIQETLDFYEIPSLETEENNGDGL